MSKQYDTSSITFKDKIDYILTAYLYCLLLRISRIRITIESGVFHVFRLLVLIFLPKKYLNRFYRRHIESLKAQDILFGDTAYGDDIMTAKTIMFNTCCCYLALPVTVTACFIFSLIGWRNIINLFPEVSGWTVIILILYAIVAVCASKLSNTSSDSHFYLSYFEEFKKKDEEWHKRWKRYTILLFVGGILSAALGIGFIFLCVIIDRNIHGPFN